jgi:hypothetical protein
MEADVPVTIFLSSRCARDPSVYVMPQPRSSGGLRNMRTSRIAGTTLEGSSTYLGCNDHIADRRGGR